jgi:hypothetical protein
VLLALIRKSPASAGLFLRWLQLRQNAASSEPADVFMCNAYTLGIFAYTLGIFDSLARCGPVSKCMPAGVMETSKPDCGELLKAVAMRAPLRGLA